MTALITVKLAALFMLWQWLKPEPARAERIRRACDRSHRRRRARGIHKQCLFTKRYPSRMDTAWGVAVA
jgi:hypothetical protein